MVHNLIFINNINSLSVIMKDIINKFIHKILFIMSICIFP